MFENEKKQAYEAASELCDKAGLKKGQILIVGCSSSEIVGERIGTNSSIEAAEAVYEGITAALAERGVYLAAQCCEHLNRAVVVEREAVPGAEPVNAVPQPKAGGSFATTAYRRFSDPVVLEEIRADAGCPACGCPDCTLYGHDYEGGEYLEFYECDGCGQEFTEVYTHKQTEYMREVR